MNDLPSDPNIEKEVPAKKELPEEEDVSLFLELRKTGDESLRTRLIREKSHLVLPIAKKFFIIHRPDETLEDLIQVGYIGLIKAVDNFHPERGNKFITYATHCVWGEIRHYMRDKSQSLKKPRWLQKLNRQVGIFIEEFLHKHQRVPTLDEIAAELNITREGILEILKSKYLISYQDVNRQNSEQMDINRIRSLRQESFRLPIEDRIVLEQAFDKLLLAEKKIIFLFFYKDLTQTQIADFMGLSQKKVSRMIQKSLEKLKKTILPEK